MRLGATFLSQSDANITLASERLGRQAKIAPREGLTR
jgi:hypothetical protein